MYFPPRKKKEKRRKIVVSLTFTLLQVAGLEPARCCHRGILSPLRLPIPPHLRTLCHFHTFVWTGRRWIRTTEAICSRFTVCPLWPLGNPPIHRISSTCIFIPHSHLKRKCFLLCLGNGRLSFVHDPTLTPVLDEVFSSLVPLRYKWSESVS